MREASLVASSNNVVVSLIIKVLRGVLCVLALNLKTPLNNKQPGQVHGSLRGGDGGVDDGDIQHAASAPAPAGTTAAAVCAPAAVCTCRDSGPTSRILPR